MDMPVTPERWRRINEVLDAVLEHEEAGRAGVLARACGADEALRGEVESLLGSLEQAGGFMEGPAESVAGLFGGGESVVGRAIGPYRVLSEIARGGMGAVYLAERADDEYSKQVAIKLVRPGPFYPEVLRRFRLERQILADLEHPNVARLLDGGTTEDGLPYVVMEHVAGAPVTEYCDRHRLSVTERLKLFRNVCSAVQFAHQNLIIHRDLKPTNILVTEAGEVKLLDFGIAKLLKPDPYADGEALTRAGLQLMTPEYASPEQVRGAPVTTASDIYSLGVVLYELLTGRHPYGPKTGGRLELERAVCEEEPERPSVVVCRAVSETLPDGTARTKLKPEAVSRTREGRPERLRARLRGDLDKIVLKALRKEARGRYLSAEQLSEDIRRHLAGEAVVAQKTTLVYRARKFVRRHRLGLAVASVFVLTLIGGMLAAAWQARVAQGHARKNRWLLHVAQMNLAAQAWDSANLERVGELLEGNRPGAGEEDLRGFEWYYLSRLYHSRRDYRTRRHAGEVWSVTFSPDGRKLASGSEDRTAKVWEAATGRELLTLSGHSEWVYCVAFSPDGKRLATASGDTTAKLWDAETGALLQTFRGHTKRVNAAAFSPDGRRLYTGGDDSMRVWDTSDGREAATFEGAGGAIRSLAVSPDGSAVVAVGSSSSAVAWDTRTRRRRLSVKVHDDWVAAVKFSPDGERFATASYDHVVKVWEAATGRELVALRGHSGRAIGLDFSPDGLRIATSGEDRTVRLWDASTGRGLDALKGHLRPVESVAFSPDGLSLASGSMDATVRLWRLADDAEAPAVLKDTGRQRVHGLAYSRDGRVLAAAYATGIMLWDAERGRALANVARPVATFSVAFSPDGRSLAVGDNAGTVSVHDARDGRELAANKAHADTVKGVAYSPDGLTLATAGYDGTVKLLDAATLRVLRSFKAHGRRVFCVTYSPDGKTLATGGSDHAIKLWDAATARELASLSGHTYWVHSLAFSPDGSRLASGAGDMTARLWDVRGGSELLRLRGHSGEVMAVAFSHDGKRLATASTDATVRLWDAATGRELISLQGHTDHVLTVAFAPDDKTLASGGRNQSVRLWRAATEALTDAKARD
jgi:WD40 repeat protein/serine/threonine protein kinase